MTLTAAERQKRVCQILSGTAAYKCTLESLRAKVTEAGAVLLQTWAARNGTQGYWAFTARIRATTGGSRWMLTSGRPSNDIFVLVFRGTLTTMNMAEWREYVRLERYKPLFGVTGAGEVYALWTEILDKIWNSPADDELSLPNGLTMRQTLWKQLEEDNEVWISGHSRGGALATTCAARLVEGRVRDDASAKLRHLSVLTFNAPKALREPLATAYDGHISREGVTHRQLFNRADRVRMLPPFAELRHVGSEEPHGVDIEFLRGLSTQDRVALGVAGVSVFACGGFLVNIGMIAGGAVYFTWGGVAMAGGTGMLGGAIPWGGRRADP